MYSFVNLSLHSSFNEHRSCNFLEKKKHCWNQQTGVWTSWQKVALWMLKALAWNGFHQLSSPAPSHFQQVNLSFYTLAFLWLWQRLYCWCSPQDFDVCDEVGVCGTIQELVRKSETSNLSEVCSGSDCHDNNMGTLTKWDKNPAQNNFNYCIFLSALAQLAYFWWWL